MVLKDYITKHSFHFIRCFAKNPHSYCNFIWLHSTPSTLIRKHSQSSKSCAFQKYFMLRPLLCWHKNVIGKNNEFVEPHSTKNISRIVLECSKFSLLHSHYARYASFCDRWRCNMTWISKLFPTMVAGIFPLPKIRRRQKCRVDGDRNSQALFSWGVSSRFVMVIVQ